MSARESAIVDSILRRAKRFAPLMVVRKRHGSGMGFSGEPDIYGCYRGLHFEVEVKTEDQKPTPLQLQRLKQWAAAGAIAGWVTSADDFFALVFQGREDESG